LKKRIDEGIIKRNNYYEILFSFDVLGDYEVLTYNFENFFSNKLSEVVYEDKNIVVEKLWQWDVCHINYDEESKNLMILFNDEAFNNGGLSTLADTDGNRLTNLTFDFLIKSGIDFFCYSIPDYKLGYIRSDGVLITKPIYDKANPFNEGLATARKDNVWRIVSEKGNELIIEESEKYTAIANFSEGLCRVSTKPVYDELYATYFDEYVGCWGFIDKTGIEIIEPKYKFASDFSGGVAIVCTMEGQYGVINKEGTDIIPCAFDEITFFIKKMDDEKGMEYVTGAFRACYSGKWGVVNNKGEWLVKPVFAEIDYFYCDGKFAFYENSESDLLGIYDIKKGRIIFKPQFYDVEFLGNEYILVEVMDINKEKIQKIVDCRDGKECFESCYSSIYVGDYNEIWKVGKKVGDEIKYGYIWSYGEEVLPCEFDVKPGNYTFEKNRFIAKTNGKEYVIDSKGNEIIPPIYDEMTQICNELYIVYQIINEKKMAGIVDREGNVVIAPSYHKIEYLKDNIILCMDENGYICMRIKSKYENLSGEEFLVNYFRNHGITEDEIDLCYFWGHFLELNNLKANEKGLDYAASRTRKMIDYRLKTAEDVVKNYIDTPWAWQTAMDFSKLRKEPPKSNDEIYAITLCIYKNNSYLFGVGKEEVKITENMRKNGRWYVYTYSD